MNKDLILKYKAEFDHWLNGGELLCLFNNPDERWFEMSPISTVWDSEQGRVKSIIINDKYSGLRAALAEGKTIQYCNRNGNYVDVIDGNFPYDISKYRIKPEDPQFKAGDKVRDTSDNAIYTIIEFDSKSNEYFAKSQYGDEIWLDEIELLVKYEPQFKVGDFVRNESISLVRQYSLSDLEYDKKAIHKNNWVKWEPQAGELCWFTHDTTVKNAAYLKEFKEVSQDLSYRDCYGNKWTYCEPFLNSKPSWFKD